MGRNTVDLSWTGATSSNIDIYRNGVLITTVPNTGFYTDRTGTTGRATLAYRVCEAGTGNCSSQVTVRFPH
jgi:serine protease